MSTVSPHTISRAIGQPKQVWLAKLRIARAAGLCDLYEPESYQFIDCGPDRMAMNPVFHEIIIRNGKPAVVASTMVGKLDLDAIEYFPRA
jgi:hypothetical protein